MARRGGGASGRVWQWKCALRGYPPLFLQEYHSKEFIFAVVQEYHSTRFIFNALQEYHSRLLTSRLQPSTNTNTPAYRLDAQSTPQGEPVVTGIPTRKNDAWGTH